MNRANRSRSRSIAFARSVALAALLAVSVCSVSQDKQHTGADNPKPDENDIKQIISMYAKAADEADPNVASHVWCDSSEDSLINPIGRWHGMEQVMGFYRHEMSDTYSVRNLKISDISVRVYTDAAWAEFNWEFAAKLRKDGSPVSFRGMETQIYQKNHDGWCLVHVHYSALPAGKKARTE
jgi:ketosteroid isomerase-like protein